MKCERCGQEAQLYSVREEYIIVKICKMCHEINKVISQNITNGIRNLVLLIPVFIFILGIICIFTEGL